MDPCYSDLQNCIFSNKLELHRFRQVVVNSVLATDLSSKEMNASRALRWKEAFSSPLQVVAVREKQLAVATELILQAGDLSHTLQTWQTFVDWNSRLFDEQYRAFQRGRSSTDPEKSWYAGETFSFDYHAIPIAEKLRACGIVSTDDLLQNARSNREMWFEYGKQKVRFMASEAKQKMSTKSTASSAKEIMAVCSNSGGSNNSSYRFIFDGEDDPFNKGYTI